MAENKSLSQQGSDPVEASRLSNQLTRLTGEGQPPVGIGSKHRTDEAIIEPCCPNCGVYKPEDQAFCGNCGQRHTRLNEGLGTFIGDFLTSFLSVDGRAFRTLTTLLFKPGKCAVDFLNGRRNRYLSTAQTYLVSGFVFFLVFGNWIDIIQIEELFTVNLDSERISIAELKRASESGRTVESANDPPLGKTEDPQVNADSQANQELERSDELNESNELGSESPAEAEPPLDSTSDNSSSTSDFLNRERVFNLNGRNVRFSIARFRQFSMQPKSEVAKFFSDQGAEFSSWEIDIIKKAALLTTDHGFSSYVSGSISLASQLALLMLPLLAVLIKLTHWRSCRTWLAAFVVSAQWHASMYLALSLLMVVNLSLVWVAGLGGSLGLFYWLGTLRRVFRQGWVVILVKTFFLVPMYGMGLVFGFAAAVLGSIFWF